MIPQEKKLPTFDLTKAFFKRQEELRAALGLGDITEHGGTKGDNTELKWINMLSQMLPGRYGVSKAFVVDADGSCSEQIDVVIHDCHFSPLLFELGHAKYISAESVYAVFEVKQELDKENMTYAADKVATVRRLHRTSAAIQHAGGTFAPVKPRRIIGGILANRSDWKPPFGDAFEACLQDLEANSASQIPRSLDIGCGVEHGAFVVERDGDGRSVGIEISEPTTALISFVMRLLKLLQMVGSAPAVDYDRYLDSVPGS